MFLFPMLITTRNSIQTDNNTLLVEVTMFCSDGVYYDEINTQLDKADSSYTSYNLQHNQTTRAWLLAPGSWLLALVLSNLELFLY